MILAHPASPLHHLEASAFKVFDSIGERHILHIVSDVMNSFIVSIEKLAEYVRPADRLDHLIRHGWAEFGKTDAQDEFARFTVVGLVGSVEWRKGVDAPWTNTYLPEATDGAFVVAGNDADLYGVAEER